MKCRTKKTIIKETNITNIKGNKQKKDKNKTDLKKFN